MYLKWKGGMKLTLYVEKLSIIKWWVDESYAFHKYHRGPTGYIVSIYGGSVTIFFQKQKIVRNSSTKHELIWVDDALLQFMWSKCFVWFQGYTVDQNILYQDNNSEILYRSIGKPYRSKNHQTRQKGVFICGRQN